MKLFLDSNIIIDALVSRNDSHESARLLLALAKLGEFNLVASPSQWTDMYYILTEGGKPSRDIEVRGKLAEVRTCVDVSMMGAEEIDRALASSWKDFEDAAVYYAALSAEADVLITNNKKDYDRADIAVYTCAEFFEWLSAAKGIRYEELAW